MLRTVISPQTCLLGQTCVTRNIRCPQLSCNPSPHTCIVPCISWDRLVTEVLLPPLFPMANIYTRACLPPCGYPEKLFRNSSTHFIQEAHNWKPRVAMMSTLTALVVPGHGDLFRTWSKTPNYSANPPWRNTNPPGQITNSTRTDYYSTIVTISPGQIR